MPIEMLIYILFRKQKYYAFLLEACNNIVTSLTQNSYLSDFQADSLSNV